MMQPPRRSGDAFRFPAQGCRDPRELRCLS